MGKCILALLYAPTNMHKEIPERSHLASEFASDGTMSSQAQLPMQSTEGETSEFEAVMNHESLCSVTFLPPSFEFVNSGCLVLFSSSGPPHDAQ